MRELQEARLEALLDRFAMIARPIILRDHLAKSCIASTWITVETFRQLGFRAEPIPVRLNVGNAAYRRLRNERGPPATDAELDEWTREHGSWVVGVGFEPAGGGIGGHVVAVVEGTHLVDASLDQTANPERGIVPPGVLWGIVDHRFIWSQGVARLDREDLLIEYQRHPTSHPYQDSTDWGHNPQTDAAVEDLLAQLRS